MKAISAIPIIILSLLANLAVANGIPETEPRKNTGSNHLIYGLPPEKQELFRQIMQKNFEDNKANYEKLRILHNEMGELMIAANFNKDAYTKKSAEALAIEKSIETSKIEAIASIAGQLSPEERKTLVKALDNRNYLHKKKSSPAEGKGKNIMESEKILD